MDVTDLDLLETARAWRMAGKATALATVVETWGSAPRRPGAHLIADADGLFLGSVSGGCVEGEVILAAQEVIATGAPRLLEFGVADETAWRAGLSCGGRIAVFVQRLDDPEPLGGLGALLAMRRAGALVTRLDDGAQWLASDPRDGGPGGLAAQALRSGQSGRVLHDGQAYFVNVCRPPSRLFLIGAVHIAQALAPMAQFAGFDVTVVDPRGAFAEPQRFPDVTLVADWPDAVFERLGLDAFTGVATLTHDPKIDDVALRLALVAPCFYVGALGSRKTQEARRARLSAQGLDAAALDRLHAPIGLAIGAVTPAEIAVAILAEAIAARRAA